MTIRELVKNKITNITDEHMGSDILDQDISTIQDKKQWGDGVYNEGYIIGPDYAFYCYEGTKQKEDKDNHLIIITGHEEVIIYNTKTKKFTSRYTR